MDTINLKDETDIEFQMEFLSDTQLDDIQLCNGVETDITFAIQHQKSTHFSAIKYYRLDTHSLEELELFGEAGGFVRIQFDGDTLTCFTDNSTDQCGPLPQNQQVPVLMRFLRIKPQNGYTISGKTSDMKLNKYTIRGSHYSALCTSPSTGTTV